MNPRLRWMTAIRLNNPAERTLRCAAIRKIYCSPASMPGTAPPAIHILIESAKLKALPTRATPSTCPPRTPITPPPHRRTRALEPAPAHSPSATLLARVLRQLYQSCVPLLGATWICWAPLYPAAIGWWASRIISELVYEYALWVGSESGVW